MTATFHREVGKTPTTIARISRTRQLTLIAGATPVAENAGKSYRLEQEPITRTAWR